MRRAAVAVGLAALPACAIALGVQDDPTLAVSVLCTCPDILSIEKDDCATLLETRLELTTPETRAAWLQTFATTCTTCPEARTCFYQPPTCVGPTNACTSAMECCSYHQTSDTNACDSGFCE